MKTTFTTTKLFATLLAIAATFQFASAQSLQPDPNWLGAWKDFAGTQHSASWLAAEIADGAALFH